MTLTWRVQQWQAQGEHVVVLGNHRVFMVRRRGEGPTLLLLHGFPSCSYDWRALLEHDSLRGRDVLALDFLRFGLSEKPPGRNSLLIQADIVEELVGRYTDGRVFLVAHDMGTSVANELFARDIEGRRAFEITGALLFNGSMLLHLAHLTLGQKLLMSKAGPRPRPAEHRALLPPAARSGVLPHPPADARMRRPTSGASCRTTTASAAATI